MDVRLLALVVCVGACEAAPPPAPAPPPKPTAPSVKDAVIDIYSAYAKDPDGYDRSDAISAFYIESNQALDAECQAGKDDPRCRGDRFACLPAVSRQKGVVEDAVVAGELPGVSATVKVTLRFGKTTVTPNVDVVFDGKRWRVDQVRCDP
jgi:hypothetical protein